MTRFFSLTALLLLACTPMTLTAGTAKADTTHDLVVRVTALSPSPGELRVALYASEEAWLTEAVVDAQSMPFDGESGTMVFRDVPAGAYAAAVFIDQNGNQLLDATLNFIPSEPYGFSNDSAAAFGPARWEEARFVHDGRVQDVKVALWPEVATQ